MKRLVDDDDKEIAEINMTPFVDIILVVLIIFMVTATFIVERKIPVDLPTAKTGEKSKKIVKNIEIAIKKDGTIYFDKQKISIPELKKKLEELKTKDVSVVLRSDKNTKFQDVVKVIDTCREAGFDKYIIETQVQ